MSLTSLFKRYGCVHAGSDSQNSVTVFMISMVKITMLLANVIMSPDNIRRIGLVINVYAVLEYFSQITARIRDKCVQ